MQNVMCVTIVRCKDNDLSLQDKKKTQELFVLRPIYPFIKKFSG